MTKPKLKSVFDNSKNDLLERLSVLCLPRDYKKIVAVINEHIASLLSDDNEFTKSLDDSEAQILNAALRFAMSTTTSAPSRSIDFEALSISTAYESELPGPSDRNAIVADMAMMLPAVICSFINPWLTAFVGAASVAIKQSLEKKQKKQNVRPVPQRVDTSRTITTDEMNNIIAGIQNVCEEVDQIVSKIRSDRSARESYWKGIINEYTLHKKFPSIIQSVQYLFMSDECSEKTKAMIEMLISSLKSYGYSVVEYSTETSGYFKHMKNPGVEVPTMHLPAVVKTADDKTVVAELGVVFIPAGSANQDDQSEGGSDNNTEEIVEDNHKDHE